MFNFTSDMRRMHAACERGNCKLLNPNNYISFIFMCTTPSRRRRHHIIHFIPLYNSKGIYEIYRTTKLFIFIKIL